MDEMEVGLEGGGDDGEGVGLVGGFFGAALRTHAESVHLLLDGGIGPECAGEGGLPAGLEFEQDALRAGGDVEAGAVGEGGVEEGGFAAGDEGEEVFEAAVHGGVEEDVVGGVGGGASYAAGGEDVGVEEVRGDGLEVQVAGGGVDDGVEVGGEGDVEGAGGCRGCSEIEAEAGDLRAAVGGEGAERAGDGALAFQDAADAGDGGEVGVGEGVAAVDGGVARELRVPGAEVAGGIDLADGFGIGEGGLVDEGFAGRGLAECEGG